MTTTYQDPSVGYGSRWRTDGPSLIFRLEGELRGAAGPEVGPGGVCLVHELQGDIVGGPLAGHHLSGLSQLTLRTDGVGRVAGPGTIECEEGSVSFEVRGHVAPPSGIGWPRPAAISTRGYEFPDHDFRVTGLALVRSAAPSYAYLDGTSASIEGWINFESGEVEVEARAM